MKEAGVLISVEGNPIYWHLPGDRSSGALPDSRTLWDVIWQNRGILRGFAHSHPGSGQPYPSGTDISTFSAIESALGRRLDWWITSSDAVIRLHRAADNTYEIVPISDPEWVKELRTRSTTERKGQHG